MASSRNGVAPFPPIPFASAVFNASVMASSIFLSEMKCSTCNDDSNEILAVHRSPSMAYFSGTGTAINMPEFNFRAFAVDIIAAASFGELILYGALKPLRRV